MISRIVLCSALLIGSAFGQADPNAQGGGQGDRAAQFQQRMAEMKTRLKTTPEQDAQLKPIITESLGKMKAVRDKYPSPRTLSPDDRKDMMAQMKAIRDDQDQKIGAILTPDQMTEYKKMQQERQGQMRERMQQQKQQEAPPQQ